jgi:predicted O-methyltransferase YrrM
MKYETYMLQNPDELAAFIKILKDYGVKSYLEVGCKFGGSLWRIGNSLPVGARIVAVDLPHGDTSFKETLPHLQHCVGALKSKGYDSHLIIGDSTAPDIIEKVYALGPFDAVFIDANHTEKYVICDWMNYRKVTKLIAFHDINFSRPNGMAPGKKPIEVPKVWNEIKLSHPFVEIKHDKQDNGIGVLWMK